MGLHVGRRRRRFSPDRNFLATCIRQRTCFSTLGGMNESPLAAVMPAVVTKASLVACTGQAMACRVRVLAADLAAVPLSAVVPSTDEERREAPEAGQLVAGYARVQGAWCDRQKLGRSSAPCDELAVDGPALGLRPKARAGDSGLHSFGAARIVLPERAVRQFSRTCLVSDETGSGGTRARRCTPTCAPLQGSAPSSPDPLRGGASRTPTCHRHRWRARNR
jgi:hypothetical protein